MISDTLLSVFPPSLPVPDAALTFLDQGCTSELGAALERFRRTMQHPWRRVSERELRSHEIAHVVFGCDVSPRMELLLDVWTLLGTDVTASGYERHRWAAAEQPLSARALATGAHGDLERVVERAKTMRGLLPWSPPAGYLTRPLCAIRAELGIELVE